MLAKRPLRRSQVTSEELDIGPDCAAEDHGGRDTELRRQMRSRLADELAGFRELANLRMETTEKRDHRPPADMTRWSSPRAAPCIFRFRPNTGVGPQYVAAAI